MSGQKNGTTAKFITLQAASALSGIAVSTIRDRVLSGELPHARVGRRVFLPMQDFSRWCESLVRRGVE